MKYFILIVAVINLFLFTLNSFGADSNDIDAAIKSLFDTLKSGGRIRHSASNMTAFLNNGQPGNDLRPGAIEKFLKAIKEEEDAKIRAQAWDLLLFLNRIRYNDKHTTRVLKDEVLIKAIIECRLRDHNGEEWVFLNTLAYDVSPEILHKFDKELSSLLIEYPNDTLIQILAKGKCYSAKTTLEELLDDERFQDEDSKEHIQMALAALGDKKLEDKFIGIYENEKDFVKKAKYVKFLGWIGTEKSLCTIAEDFRTDIIYETKFEKISLRVDIQYALIYNFPEEALLSKRIKSDKDYANIEKFLEEKYGIKWKTARPPFFTSITTHLVY